MAERGGVEPTASEAPDAHEPPLTINDVAKVLKALENVFDWYALGTYLEVASHELGAIQAENHTIRSRMIKMLEQWLRSGRDCSWRKLVEALYRLGELTVADNICRNLSLTTPVMPKYLSGHDPSAAPEARALLAMKNKQRLMSKFSSLVNRLSTRLTELNIEFVRLQTYLTTFGCEHVEFVDDIQRQSTLLQLFNAISCHKLWDYLNFDLASYMVEEFAEDDEKCLDLLGKYKRDFTGYLLTTEIVHHISAVRVQRGEGSTATPPEDISSEELCSKLTVKLDIDVTTHSLKYVEEVWKTILKRSQLPKHTLLLREIAKSSLVITWLLPKSKAGEVADAVWQNADELQLKRVVLVTIDGANIFQADPIKVDDELQSLADTIEADLDEQLVEAAREGRVGLVASLLEQGAGVNSSKDEQGFTPLVAGCDGGSTEVVKLLIEHGADVNLRAEITEGNRSGTATPLCRALWRGHEEVAALLMEHGADVHAVGWEAKEGEDTASLTPLILAAGVGLQHAARLLLQGGAEVDKEVEGTFEGKTLSVTALMFADNFEVATLLLEHGAQINLQASRGGLTALMVASNDGRYEVAQLLLEHGAAVDLQDNEGTSALMYAVKKRDDNPDKDRVGLARLLLQHGANPQLQDEEGTTPLSLAVGQGDAELIELLTDPAKASSSDHTPQQPPEAPPTTPQQHGKAPRRKQGKRSIFGKIGFLFSNIRSRSREVFLK